MKLTIKLLKNAINIEKENIRLGKRNHGRRYCVINKVFTDECKRNIIEFKQVIKILKEYKNEIE